MIYPYEDSLDVRAWMLEMPTGEYVFLPGPQRPGGPVFFTGLMEALHFLDYHAEAWGTLDAATPVETGSTLGQLLAHWRRDFARQLDGGPMLFTLLYVNPRPPFGFAHDLDAEALSLVGDPRALPEGVEQDALAFA